MVSESYVAVVKQIYSQKQSQALRCYSKWFQSHELTADAYESLPEVAPESTKLYRVKQEAPRAMDSTTGT